MSTWAYEGIQCYVSDFELTSAVLPASYGAIAMPADVLLRRDRFKQPLPVATQRATSSRTKTSIARVPTRKLFLVPFVRKHVPLYRAWNGSDHFYTTNKAEYDGLPSRYAREGVQCFVAKAAEDGHVPLYRLYRGDIDDHFYTTSESEKTSASGAGWSYEGIAGYVSQTPSPKHIPLYRAYHPGIGDHFYTTSMEEIEAVAPQISRVDLKAFIKKSLKNYLKAGYNIYFADSNYHMPQKHIAEALINASQVAQLSWIAEKFDCDDFAHLLKAAFIKDAYTNGLRRLPYSFGIIWGESPAHAMNLLVASDGEKKESYVIEPQTGAFYKPSDGKLDDIYLVVI
jgi:hypothetical protein